MDDDGPTDISSPVILLSRFVSNSKDLVTLSLPPSCRLVLKSSFLSLYFRYKHAARIVATPGCPTKWVLSSADPHYPNVQLKLSGNQVINFLVKRIITETTYTECFLCLIGMHDKMAAVKVQFLLLF
jgi:hypothetical protein